MQPAAKPLLYPWIEYGAPDAAALDAAAAAGKAGEGLCAGLFFVTSSWYDEAVADLRRRLRGTTLAVVPGIKLGNQPEFAKDFAAAAGWQAVAKAIPKLIAAAGTGRQVVFEAETPLGDVTNGRKSLNYKQLSESLKSLPRELKYVWYPGQAGLGQDPGKAYYHMLRLWTAVEEGLPFVRFTTWGLSHAPFIADNEAAVFRDHVTRRFCRQLPLDCIYLGSWKKTVYWEPAKIKDAMRLVRSPDAFLWCDPARRSELLDAAVKAVS